MKKTEKTVAEQIGEFCRTLPGVTEDVKWGDDLCFLIGGKMFCVTCRTPIPDNVASFKCTDEDFVRLIATKDYIPAPYLARAKWVLLTNAKLVRSAEFRGLLRKSYELILAKLPKKVQAKIAEAE
jgi:predicted DNA-binding protein (MmcQ/YjbR family)